MLRCLSASVDIGVHLGFIWICCVRFVFEMVFKCKSTRRTNWTYPEPKPTQLTALTHLSDNLTQGWYQNRTRKPEPPVFKPDCFTPLATSRLAPHVNTTAHLLPPAAHANNMGVKATGAPPTTTNPLCWHPWMLATPPSYISHCPLNPKP